MDIAADEGSTFLAVDNFDPVEKKEEIIGCVVSHVHVVDTALLLYLSVKSTFH